MHHKQYFPKEEESGQLLSPASGRQREACDSLRGADVVTEEDQPSATSPAAPTASARMRGRGSRPQVRAAGTQSISRLPGSEPAPLTPVPPRAPAAARTLRSRPRPRSRPPPPTLLLLGLGQQPGRSARAPGTRRPCPAAVALSAPPQPPTCCNMAAPRQPTSGSHVSAAAAGRGPEPTRRGHRGPRGAGVTAATRPHFRFQALMGGAGVGGATRSGRGGRKWAGRAAMTQAVAWADPSRSGRVKDAPFLGTLLGLSPRGVAATYVRLCEYPEGGGPGQGLDYSIVFVLFECLTTTCNRGTVLLCYLKYWKQLKT